MAYGYDSPYVSGFDEWMPTYYPAYYQQQQYQQPQPQGGGLGGLLGVGGGRYLANRFLFNDPTLASYAGTPATPELLSATRVPGSQGFFGLGSTASNLLGAGGVALGGYSALKGIKEGDPVKAGLGGGGVGLGLNALGYSLGPIGWAAALGAPLIGSLFKKFGDKDMWKTEGNRLRKLEKQGTYVPEGLLAGLPTGGRSKEELIDIAKRTGGNVKFAESRNEGDLTGQDIVGYSAFAQKNPDWFLKPLDTRINVAQKALDLGAAREHHGTVDIDWTPELETYAADLLGKAPNLIPEKKNDPYDPNFQWTPGFFQNTYGNKLKTPTLQNTGAAPSISQDITPTLSVNPGMPAPANFTVPEGVNPLMLNLGPQQGGRGFLASPSSQSPDRRSAMYKRQFLGL